ncbi:hypothetical protein BpHYR1_049137 [Brachionus plicatilis]|uniref:Uncharacterized protein n=1 Tax=Brachionus plicatilis TaxID=10195 RepID=A0A3M7SKS2_BRAPC|nr:hypothetical protein BpHYR1_049137 [Brachionus plicatilis]
MYMFNENFIHSFHPLAQKVLCPTFIYCATPCWLAKYGTLIDKAKQFLQEELKRITNEPMSRLTKNANTFSLGISGWYQDSDALSKSTDESLNDTLFSELSVIVLLSLSLIEADKSRSMSSLNNNKNKLFSNQSFYLKKNKKLNSLIYSNGISMFFKVFYTFNSYAVKRTETEN